MEYLNGVVERITFVNEENGFCVIKVKSRGYQDLVTVVGNLASVNVGAAVSMKGEWKHDSKYGKQFSVQFYTETIPATVGGIEKYLGSGLIKGIGPVNAKRIVKKFKEATIEVIEQAPDRLNEIEGIGPKRVEMIKKAWQEQKEIKNVMLFLQGQGVSTTYAVKIFKTYGNESIKKVSENPYRLADDIWGIGFRTADRIAQKLGFDRNSIERCRSGIIYVLNQLSDDGHCFAYKTQLIEEAVKILELPSETVGPVINEMLEEKSLISDQEDIIYLPAFFYSETGVVKRIREISAGGNKYAGAEVGRVLLQVESERGIVFDEIQVEAIKAAVNSKFMVLTGGPGTGKTTATIGIINVFEKLGAKVLLAAPTGRAAKRMTETTCMEARTIHRLLEYKPPEGYKRNSENPLECDVLIIDETSMVDIVLAYNLLKAVANDTIVIFVGDVDQLPSVNAGNVLRDIIESGAIKVVRLKKIFRQAQGSMIIMNAHRINKGEYPILNTGRDSDFFFSEAEDPAAVLAQIKELCSKRLPEYFKLDSVSDIQVLCPMQRGETGAANLNILLQETLNPCDSYIKYGGIQYRLNDKVMQIKNNYDKNVFNGDIGNIIFIDQEDKKLVIRYDFFDVEYDATELDEVVLAYAITVHKSQGSEYKVVVAPFTMQFYIMLQRNLLYTCVTRAKKALVLVGSKKAVALAVRNDKSMVRNTLLAERLR